MRHSLGVRPPIGLRPGRQANRAWRSARHRLDRCGCTIGLRPLRGGRACHGLRSTRGLGRRACCCGWIRDLAPCARRGGTRPSSIQEDGSKTSSRSSARRRLLRSLRRAPWSRCRWSSFGRRTPSSFSTLAVFRGSVWPGLRSSRVMAATTCALGGGRPAMPTRVRWPRGAVRSRPWRGGCTVSSPGTPTRFAIPRSSIRHGSPRAT